MKKTFTLNPAITHDVAMHALYKKLLKPKPILECILSAILSEAWKKEIVRRRLGGDEYLDQIMELQDHIESIVLLKKLGLNTVKMFQAF